MTETSNTFKEIRIFGLDDNFKQCNRCKRPNNSKNTLCWYCASRFEQVKND